MRRARFVSPPSQIAARVGMLRDSTRRWAVWNAACYDPLLHLLAGAAEADQKWVLTREMGYGFRVLGRGSWTLGCNRLLNQDAFRYGWCHGYRHGSPSRRSDLSKVKTHRLATLVHPLVCPVFRAATRCLEADIFLPRRTRRARRKAEHEGKQSTKESRAQTASFRLAAWLRVSSSAVRS